MKLNFKHFLLIFLLSLGVGLPASATLPICDINSELKSQALDEYQNIKFQSSEGSKTVSTVELDTSALYFKGHFPERLILPGKEGIHFAIRSRLNLRSHPERYFLKSARNVKFLGPVEPGEGPSVLTLKTEGGDSPNQFSIEASYNGKVTTKGQVEVVEITDQMLANAYKGHATLSANPLAGPNQVASYFPYGPEALRVDQALSVQHENNQPKAVVGASLVTFDTPYLLTVDSKTKMLGEKDLIEGMGQNAALIYIETPEAIQGALPIFLGMKAAEFTKPVLLTAGAQIVVTYQATLVSKKIVGAYAMYVFDVSASVNGEKVATAQITATKLDQ